MDRREICFLHYVFEAYDGLATVTTLDSDKGIIRLSLSPGSESEVRFIIADLKSMGILIEDPGEQIELTHYNTNG